ncbi:hypothetical protein F5Y13DRAFT_206377 [Hypoxylon sp. FL1857]|nr:hypothetical protein F5Y13DRAFT_206377 [Hypoxylon sp. FL1857]
MTDETQTETPETMFERDIKLMYDGKSPFFNRIRLRRLADELSMHRQGLIKENKIILKNLKGQDVELILDPDQPSIFEDWRCNHGDRRRDPYIYYRCIQKMATHGDMKWFDARQAYLPFVVLYPDPTEFNHEHEETGSFPHSYTTEELGVIFKLGQENWETCLPYRNIRQTIRSLRPALCNVSKIVAFGCGPLSHRRSKDDYSITQHALVLSLQKILTRMKPENIGFRAAIREVLSKGGEFDGLDNVVRCIAQDPAYTDIDKEVLKDRGFVIEYDPRGFLAIDDRTVVVSISVNTPVQQIICDIARPVAIIQMKVIKGWSDEGGQNCSDARSSRVNEMLANEYELVTLDYHPRLRDIEMYVRKSSH